MVSSEQCFYLLTDRHEAPELELRKFLSFERFSVSVFTLIESVSAPGPKKDAAKQRRAE